MARIRSIHPSFFTDEGCVSCSPLARLLYIGLWTDADDQGLFEWKPLQLKMRLLPGDNADAPTLLAELVEAGLVTRFEHGGKAFGAIRDFRTFQRPKKPNRVHHLPEEFRTYVGLDACNPEPQEDDAASAEDHSTLSGVESATGTEPVPHQFPAEGEKSPQMEDGGEDVEEDEGKEETGFALVAASAPTAKPAGPRKAKATKFVPPDWQPSASHQAKAAELGVDLAAQAELFRLHEFKDPKSDFDLAFHRWLRNAPTFAGRPANQNLQRGAGRRDWDPMDQAVNGIDWDAPTEDAA